MGIAKQQEEQKKRLQSIDKTYRSTIAKAEAKFNKVYDAKTTKYGLNITTLMDHNRFPPEFHGELADARAEYVAAISAAQQAQRTGVASLPRRRQVIRAN